MATEGERITCKAAVAYEAGKPLSVEDIHVDPPLAREVRIKITHNAICHTDLYYWQALQQKDENKPPRFPRILGHEAAGIVESVGAEVRKFKAGDHVIPAWQAECGQCRYCKSGRTNVCEVFLFYYKDEGVMFSDGKSRFSRVADGKPIYHFFGASTFSQYTICDDVAVAKVDPRAPLERICLLGCGVSTGIGTAWNIAKVSAGSTVAVFGLGTIGLAGVEGARIAGASRIIGVDKKQSALERAKKFGLTDTINVTEINKPVEEVIQERTNGGVQHSLEATGVPQVQLSAMRSTHKAMGIAAIVGFAAVRAEITYRPIDMLLGRTWTSGIFGGFRGPSDLPKLVDKYMNGEINLDHYVTHNRPLSKIMEAFELMEATECIRCVVHYFDENVT